MKTRARPAVFLSFFFLGFFSILLSRAEGADFYVDGSSGDDSRDGLSWGTAKKTVTAAISAANATGEMDTIRVAAGTYVENLVLTTPEVLLGGYPVGGGERDWEANTTILDGGRLGSVVSIERGSYGTVVGGFTITNGYAEYGGGVNIDAFSEDSTPDTIVQNCTITGNEAGTGGGIFAVDTNTRILNNRITGNIAAGLNPAEGGGIAIGQAYRGIFIVEGNIISNNISQNPIDQRGGGIWISDLGDTSTVNPELRVFVRNNVIRGNEGCGVRVECCASLFNNEISENAGAGVAFGPVYWFGGNPVWRVEISNNTIVDNTEYGLLNHWPIIWIDITRSIVWGNSTTSNPELADHWNFTYSLTQDVRPGDGNLSADPLFITGPGGNYYLSQIAAGQGTDSPALDSGGVTAVEAGVAFRSTRTDGIRDSGIADMGFHYPPSSFSIFRGTDPTNLPAYVTDIQLPYTDTGARTDLSFPLLFYRVDTDQTIILRPSGADVRILFFADRF